MRFPLLVCSLLFVVCGAVATAQGADEKPGYSAEPPASGPKIKTEHGYMVPYTVNVPGTDVTFEMVPIPGGKFKLGSSKDEEGHEGAEGPQVEVEVAPFWMGRCEVTWGEYLPFMALVDEFKTPVPAGMETDAISAPSKLYDPTTTFENGREPNLPAATMSQYAAKQYTKWLSKATGDFYCLPTEAQWEYACRAGTTTPYSFGDDSEQLGDYAWYFDSSEETTHPVGGKKPNPWGLHDMHGNVAEWVLDEFSEKGYKEPKGDTATVTEMLVWPTKLFPRVLRGGSFDSDADQCRSASRLPSDDKAWYEIDPNLPKSPWWFTETESLGVGFRVVRLVDPPAKEQWPKYWDADVESVRDAVTARLQQGRGAAGLVKPPAKEGK